MDLFAGQIEWLASGRYDRRIEAQAFAAPRRLMFLHNAFNTAQDELPGGTALAGGELTQTPMQRPGNIERCSNGLLGHKTTILLAT
jgi:hypothetical protein